MRPRDLGAALVIGVVLAASAARAQESSLSSECAPIPLYSAGRPAETVCAERGGELYAVLDLRDDWTPLVFSETPALPQPYRPTLLALANERVGLQATLRTARHDRYYELFGIFPSLAVIRARLVDGPRHACHAAIDDTPLSTMTRTIAPWDQPSPETAAARAAAVRVVQAHLTCEGFLPATAGAGVLDAATTGGLALYQRRHMIPSLAVVDAETRQALLTASAELDFRTLLRALRERVADAAALLEDGSASATWEPVLGRFIDSPEYRPRLRPRPLPNGAPDLVDRATEAVAMALGWTSPEAATASLRQGLPERVAVRLPARPAYASRIVSVRAEIDRGDVWKSYPLDAEGRPRPSPAKNRPTFTLFATTPEGEVALVRWPTTIGAWKEEKLPDDTVDLRYKASPVGRAYWRDLLAAPSWFPPPTTPDRELVRPQGPGQWGPDHDGVGPGYRSAYGLVALLHHRATDGVDAAELSDLAIRTHGSGNYRSIMRGSSHGCHRLFNHLAIRLGSYLLAHHGYERQGTAPGSYARTLHWKGHTLELRVDGRGYRYELRPPIVVDVLPGRTVRSRAAPAPPPPPPQPQLPTPKA